MPLRKKLQDCRGPFRHGNLPGPVTVGVGEETEARAVIEPLLRIVFEVERWRHALAEWWWGKRGRWTVSEL